METRNFRTATFGGFDKQDVLDAFEELSNEHKTQVEDLQRQLNALQSTKFELSTDFEKFRASEQDKNELIGKLQLLIKKQNADNDKLKQINIAVEKQAKEIRLKNEELKRQLEERVKQAAALEKQLKDAGSTAEIGYDNDRLKALEESGYTAERILSEANARSASTLADANKRSSAILTEAAKKAAKNIEDATRRADDLVTKAEDEADKIKFAAQEYNQQAKKKLNDLAIEISEKEKRATIKSAEMVREAKAKSEAIVKEAKGKLYQANKQYVRFTRELESVKTSMQEKLQDVAVQVDRIDQGLPSTLDLNWLGDSAAPQEESEKDELFRKQMIESGMLSEEDLKEENEVKTSKAKLSKKEDEEQFDLEKHIQTLKKSNDMNFFFKP